MKRLYQEYPLSYVSGTALRTKFLRQGAKEASDLLNDLVRDGILKKCDVGKVPHIIGFYETSFFFRNDDE